MLNLYEKYHVAKEYTSIGLFREVMEKYGVGRVLYPGCYVHITPSLIFSNVTYVDSFRNTYKFYESSDVIEYVSKHKEYPEEPRFVFYQQDYFKDIPVEQESFDIIISQYGGFVGQATKKYLKKGGVLVCNNSHGDASMAYLDTGYELVAVYNRRSDKKFSLSESDLGQYFIPKKDKEITKEYLKKLGKGIDYTKSPSGYIFMKK